MSNILIIDDDSGTRETLSDILQEEGYKVACAETGAQSLECLQKEEFQAVLLDLKLPDMNGLDILKDAMRLNPGLKVIVVSGYATLENTITALNEGAYAYITKPINMEMVKAIIKQAIMQYEFATKKREAEEEVRRLKEYNESILMSLPYAIIIFDKEQIVECVNLVYLNDFNLQEEAVINKNLFEVLPFTNSQKENIKQNIKKFLSGELVHTEEVKIDQRTFGYRFFDVLKGLLGEQKTGLIMRDSTSEKKIQQQLIQSEKLAGIGTMAMGIAHELNNPLFGIMGMAEALLAEKDPEKIKEYTEDIIKYSRNTAVIVKGLSIYSRSTEAGDMLLIDVNEKLNEAVKIARHSEKFDGVKVIKEYQSNKKILINSGELQQVFVNIINNAAHALNGNGELKLLTKSEEDSVVVQICDNGPGISKDFVGKIFEPFFTTKDPDKGTGLGLNIVYRIVQKYNGNISVESEKGKGTTFTIHFPIGE
jgi:two-component system, NtrC family, sensor kinase